MASTGVSAPERVQKISCFSCRCFKINQWVSFPYGLCNFQTGIYVQGSCASEFFSEPFKSTFSVPYSSMAFLYVIPIGLQSKAFWTLICPVKDLGFGVHDVEHRLFTSQGKVLYF